MSDDEATDADRAWLVGMLAPRAGIYRDTSTSPAGAGITWDSYPACGDWENLFGHIRAEILARRDPQPPSVHANESVRDGVGSQ